MARVRWCLMLFEALAYTARRRDLAVLLNGLKAYLHAHPLRTSRWRPLLLFSIITVLPHFALFVGQMSQIPARGAVGTTQAVAYVVLFSVGAFVSACLYMRILCPLAVLRAAAADLRIDWKRAVLAALGEDAIIHDHDAVPHDHNASPPVLHGHDTVLHDYDAGLQSPEAILHNRSIDGHMAALAWRALRQRQLLLHDLVRKSSDANGPCILALLLSLAGLTTGAMDVLESDLNDADVVPALLYYVLFIVYVLAVTAVCQWPATEVRPCKALKQYKSAAVVSSHSFLLVAVSSNGHGDQMSFTTVPASLGAKRPRRGPVSAQRPRAAGQPVRPSRSVPLRRQRPHNSDVSSLRLLIYLLRDEGLHENAKKQINQGSSSYSRLLWFHQ
ncbi:uncharacterized protein LOC117651040 isoform X1 [Thrips palmi]|uniref:Uncharacterized protein LOC117651040 isoform X1 n=1 Tax=Thrips palmi TaxID=161013 RepID=A0A6P9A193_THRPL|nr:uncharacterized protein LOC117651040 isoform X1 [Thrips palmi]